MNKGLFIGKVYHKRFSPKIHEFWFRVFYIRFSIEHLNELKSLFFSINRWNLFSFYLKDHGAKDGSDLKPWALTQLKKHGISQSVDRIELQTFPRVLGYVFNPVSFWYCYSQNKMVAIIAEVNNTFGETHSYVIENEKDATTKTLHVSPFFQIEGYYKFKFENTNSLQDTTSLNVVNISYYKNHTDQNPVLVASLQAKYSEMNDKNLFRAFLKTPFLTYVIILGIHFHALVLFLKKVPFYGTNGKIRKV